MLKVRALEGKEDVIGNKLLKAFGYVKERVIKEGWKIKESNWHWKENALFYYIVERKRLSKEVIHYGPPKKLNENVLAFKKKWKDYKLLQDNYRIYIKLKRKHTEIKPFVKALLKEKYLKNLVKSIEFN